MRKSPLFLFRKTNQLKLIDLPSSHALNMLSIKIIYNINIIEFSA